MSELIDYVIANTIRGACTCGLCLDAPANPQEHQPDGHTADMIFFKVATLPSADASALRSLIRDHRGEHCDCDPLDGKEHSYIELGGWIGDQGVALMLMGLGSLVGLWKLLSPVTLLGLSSDDPLAQQAAGMGFLSIQSGEAIR